MTFLEQALNRDGVKQIYVFNSNDGWGPGRGRSVIASAFPAAQVSDSVLAVDSKHGIEGAARTAAWLNSLNIKQNTAAATDKLRLMLTGAAFVLFSTIPLKPNSFNRCSNAVR